MSQRLLWVEHLIKEEFGLCLETTIPPPPAGSVGLPGPPIILLYMASSLPARVIRANCMIYLILADIILLAVLWWSDFLVISAIALGGLMIAPYFVGNWLGAMLFRPEAERTYRIVAYAIIAGSAILGLPIWD